MSCYNCDKKIRSKIDSLLEKRYNLDISIHKGMTNKQRLKVKEKMSNIEKQINELDPKWKRFNKYKT